jgi:chromosomal replication initiator protein
MRSIRNTTARPALAPTSAVLEAALIEHLGRERYDLWFAQRTELKPSRDELVIVVPNQFLREWLAKQFGAEVAAAVRAAAGRPLPIRYLVEPLAPVAEKSKAEAAPLKLPEAPRPSPPDDRQYAERPAASLYDGPAIAQAKRTATRPSRRWRRLEEFVVGPCNRVACAASQSAVEAPGQGPSPLVIHGPVGTGKTHLLEGIYVGLRQQAPNWRITCATAEEFTNRFIQAMRTGQSAQFRKQFRECDALLIDDLHFVAGKKKTQEELLHTVDVLAADGKPLVVTCDCHPRLTDDFVPELADRLMGGAVWGLQPPDAATRLDVLRAKSARLHASIDESVLRFLADQLRGNVRELEGALNSLRHFSRVTGRPIDVSLTREAIGDLLRHSIRVVHLSDVDAAVCQVLRMAPGTLQTKVRAWSVSHPRMIAMYLARKLTRASYSEVGAHFGDRNHSTAVAAEKKVRHWISSDESLAFRDRAWRVREIVERVERTLGR